VSGSRSLARRCVLQALYQWQISGDTPAEVVRQFEEERGLGRADKEYFRELFNQVCGRVDELSAELAPFIDRPFAELDPVERSVLWFGAQELQQHLEIPYRVVINEAVDQARLFGGEDGYKFVNAVLDKMAAETRSVEKDF
jgi:transcription antitermination protein NusB